MHVESPAGRAAARARHALALAHRRPEDTALHRALRENLETFLARADQRGRSIPRFVVHELRAYLECGLLPFGFVRVRCAQCGVDRLVAFSCKGRGSCPSCVGRRMADTAAHLIDRVLRQRRRREFARGRRGPRARSAPAGAALPLRGAPAHRQRAPPAARSRLKPRRRRAHSARRCPPLTGTTLPEPRTRA